MQSTMNLDSLPRQDGCVLDDPPRKRGTSTLPRRWKQTEQKCLVDYSDPLRTTFILEKQDNESFGFEIQTYGHPRVEMCTFVCMVHKHSAAECAGLTAGDVILTVNGRSIEGSPHHHVVDAIRQSDNVLKMETVCGMIMKRIEMENKRNLLKQTLREKWEELQTLVLLEQRLMRGDSPDGTLTPSSMDSLVSPDVFPGHRFSSDSSYRSSMTEDSDQASVFGDTFSPSPVSMPGDGCFFSQGFPDQQESRRKTMSSGSFSVLLSSGSSSPSPTYWDETRASSLFGTLPRKGRKGSVHRYLRKLIPRFHRSVEEEEELDPNGPCSLDRVFSTGQNQQNNETKAFS